MFRPFVKTAAIWLKDKVPGFDKALRGRFLRGIRATRTQTEKTEPDPFTRDADRLALRFVNPAKTHGADGGVFQLDIHSQPSGPNDPGAEVTPCGHPTYCPVGCKLVFSVNQATTMMWDGEAVPLTDPTKITVAVRDEETWVTASGPTKKRLKTGERLSIRVLGPVEEFVCPCGRARCCGAHRLEGWPAENSKITLASFVASATKGPAPEGQRARKKASPSIGGFVQSMYYALLASEQSAPWPLLAIRTERTVCRRCGRELHPGETQECQHSVGDQAETCGTRFDVRFSRRISRLRLHLMQGHYRHRRECAAALLAEGRTLRASVGIQSADGKTTEVDAGANWRQAVGSAPSNWTVAEWDRVLPSNWKAKLGEDWDNLYAEPKTFREWYAARAILNDRRKCAALARQRGLSVAEFESGLRPKIEPFDRWLECTRLLEDKSSLAARAEEMGIKVEELESQASAKVAAFRAACGCPICGSVPHAKSSATHVWVPNLLAPSRKTLRRNKKNKW